MSDEAPRTRLRGFRCPTCAAPLKVIKTRRKAAGLVGRRRACPHCGYRVTTAERPVGPPGQSGGGVRSGPPG